MRRVFLIALLVTAAGCTKSESYFFQGTLIEQQPGGATVEIPVLLERELIPSQNKIVILNHQAPKGSPRHFSTIYDFSSGKMEMREGSNLLSQGTFHCERAGSGLDTLTACTYAQQTPAGDSIRGTDSYDGTRTVSFDTAYTVKKENAVYRYSGGAQSLPEAEFRTLLKQRFPASSGCFIGPAGTDAVSGGALVAGILIPVVLARARRRRGLPR